jgi:hypothetical protein
MSELLNVEAERRAKLLLDTKCDNLKDYNKKQKSGTKMPYIYLVMDEVVSVVANVAYSGADDKEGKANAKEFQRLMQTIVTKLPYVGIGLILVPHRAIGVVDTMVRDMMQLRAAVRADEKSVEEALGERIDRPLTMAGDIALRGGTMSEAQYVRGPAAASSDDDTLELFEAIARGYYKLGVDIPDWSHLPLCHNRDEESVRERLVSGDQRHEQF